MPTPTPAPPGPPPIPGALSRIPWKTILSVVMFVLGTLAKAYVPTAAAPAPVVVVDPNPGGPSITAPASTTVAPGDLAVIDASGSVADQFTWVPLSGKSIAASDSGRSGYFTSTTPGSYHFLIVGAGVVDGRARMARSVTTVEVVDGLPGPDQGDDDPSRPKPTPRPKPKPTPPRPKPAPPAPSPLTAAAKAYRDAQASALRSVAADVSAGRVGRDQASLMAAMHTARMPTSKALADLILASPDPAAALIEAAGAIEGGK